MSDKHQTLDFGLLVRKIRRRANKGTWNGRDITGYFERCRRTIWQLGCNLIFTRDVGYHTSGWWKNPDYERCYHLSLSFFSPVTEERLPKDKGLTDLMILALFDRHKRWLWCEPPYSEHGKTLDVWHYRLFCDEGWKPIKPRGEVYSRELTAAGWKSFSDVQAEEARRERQSR